MTRIAAVAFAAMISLLVFIVSACEKPDQSGDGDNRVSYTAFELQEYVALAAISASDEAKSSSGVAPAGQTVVATGEDEEDDSDESETGISITILRAVEFYARPQGEDFVTAVCGSGDLRVIMARFVLAGDIKITYLNTEDNEAMNSTAHEWTGDIVVVKGGDGMYHSLINGMENTLELPWDEDGFNSATCNFMEHIRLGQDGPVKDLSIAPAWVYLALEFDDTEAGTACVAYEMWTVDENQGRTDYESVADSAFAFDKPAEFNAIKFKR
ncbi:MAG: hypothetical protein FWE62_04225 [Firmicutes bacterium]|nr:hypothetical protein [Bacillota bacterium]